MDTVGRVLVNVDELLLSINNSSNYADKNSIANILVNAADSVQLVKKQLNQVDEILNNFKALSQEMKTPDNMVRRLIDPKGDVMFNSIQKSLDSLTKMMENLEKFSVFINGQQNQIDSLLYESKSAMKDTRDVLEGVKNNPLLKGGISEKKPQEKLNESIREKDF